MELINLYSQAMEYYLQTDPTQSKYYQGRMEYLITDKDTLKKLKKQSENITSSSNSPSNALSTNYKY